jgi:hypothetical protein
MFDFLLEDSSANKVFQENGEDFSKKVITVGHQLFESKFKDMYPTLGNMFESNDPKDHYIAGDTMIVLRNQQLFIEGMKKRYGESVIVSKLGDLAPRILDVTRIFYPNQISHIITSMQPLTQMMGQAIVVKPIFTNDAGGVSKGEIVFQKQTNGQYASEESTEVLGTGDGSTKTFGKTLSFLPVRVKSITVYVDGVAVGTDDGNGNITGATIDAGTINAYETGVVSVTFTDAPASTKAVTITYLFNTEIDATNIREVEINLRIIPVQAKEHPLKISWSVPAAFAANAAIGLDVEDTLSVLAGQFIKTERDRYVVNYISRLAGNPVDALAFNCTAYFSTDRGYPRRVHYQDFKIRIAQAEQLIFNAAGRGSINWIVCGTNVASLMVNLDGYVPEVNVVPIGAHVIGTLDGNKIIIKDPGLDTDTWIAGYNGILPGDAGVIMAEWIPIYFTPTITDVDLKGRKAALSMYDVVTNMSQYYVKGKISNFGV